MPTGTLAPYAKLQLFTDSGLPAAGWQLFTYAAGTTTKLATYTDYNLTTPNTNPIVLDAAGRCTIYLASYLYKWVLAPPTDTDPPSVPLWTVDPVNSTPGSQTDLDTVATAGENLLANDVVYMSDGSGGKTAGLWYKASASNAYSSVAAAAVGMAPAALTATVTGVVRLLGRLTGLSALTTGSDYFISATPGVITLTPPTLARPLGRADSTTSFVLTHPQTDTQSISGSKTFLDQANFSQPPLFKPAGWSTFGATVSARIFSNFTPVGTANGVGEHDLMTWTLPAGTLNVDGIGLHVIGWGKTVSNANAKILRAYFGARITIGDMAFTINEAGSWLADYWLIRSSATSQRTGSTVQCGPSGSAVTMQSCSVVSPAAEILANALTIKFTGNTQTANDITQEGMIVTLL